DQTHERCVPLYVGKWPAASPPAPIQQPLFSLAFASQIFYKVNSFCSGRAGTSSRRAVGSSAVAALSVGLPLLPLTQTLTSYNYRFEFTSLPCLEAFVLCPAAAHVIQHSRSHIAVPIVFARRHFHQIKPDDFLSAFAQTRNQIRRLLKRQSARNRCSRARTIPSIQRINIKTDCHVIR